MAQMWQSSRDANEMVSIGGFMLSFNVLPVISRSMDAEPDEVKQWTVGSLERNLIYVDYAEAERCLAWAGGEIWG